MATKAVALAGAAGAGLLLAAGVWWAAGAGPDESAPTTTPAPSTTTTTTSTTVVTTTTTEPIPPTTEPPPPAAAGRGQPSTPTSRPTAARGPSTVDQHYLTRMPPGEAGPTGNQGFSVPYHLTPEQREELIRQQPVHSLSNPTTTTSLPETGHSRVEQP